MSSASSADGAAATRAHYERHLGPVYAWMAGDFEALCRRNDEIFDRLGLGPVEAGSAVDLGAGHGGQSVPLARRGYRVTALDFCAPLLKALRRNARGLAVTAVEADLIGFESYVSEPVDVIVCMGDTLPHLPSRKAVKQLIRTAARTLAPNGTFVATFRDYVSAQLQGEHRFIPVRADDELILTCFLDYVDADTLEVYDLLYRKSDGRWLQEVGSYRKLRIDPRWVERLLEEAGLEPLERSASAGMITVAARQPRR